MICINSVQYINIENISFLQMFYNIVATVDPNFVQSALFPYRKQKRVRTAFSPSQLLQVYI